MSPVGGLAFEPGARSFREARARDRVAGIVDPGSFEDLCPPDLRLTSPHLPELGMPVSFDDGVVVGRGRIAGRAVLLAAQEGGFMGGAVGEVHGAKLVGLLERALEERPDAVVLLFDTGGVRLHEANAGLAAIAEIQDALLALRAAGITSVAALGSAAGCHGGIGIVTASCDAVVMSEEARLGVSGPEVIETVAGVEEMDARDRALVWRTYGGKHRYLLGDADDLVVDRLEAFREAIIAHLDRHRPLDLHRLETEQARLADRLADLGARDDALEIWARLGAPDPGLLPELELAEFLEVARGLAGDSGRGAGR